MHEHLYKLYWPQKSYLMHHHAQLVLDLTEYLCNQRTKVSNETHYRHIQHMNTVREISFAIALVLWITLHLIYLMTWFNQSTCWEPQEWFTACDEYHCFHASLSTCFHESLSLCRIIAFIKAQTWTFTRKAVFSQDQEQVSEGSKNADSDKSRRREMGKERERKGRRRRRESVPKPLNEIRAQYRIPLISIVEIISSSSSALMGSWNLNSVFSIAQTAYLSAV